MCCVSSISQKKTVLLLGRVTGPTEQVWFFLQVMLTRTTSDASCSRQTPLCTEYNKRNQIL